MFWGKSKKNEKASSPPSCSCLHLRHRHEARCMELIKLSIMRIVMNWFGDKEGKSLLKVRGGSIRLPVITEELMLALLTCLYLIPATALYSSYTTVTCSSAALCTPITVQNSALPIKLLCKPIKGLWRTFCSEEIQI